MSTMEAVLDPQFKLNVAVNRPRTPQRRRVSQRLQRSREERAMQATSKLQQAPSRRYRDVATAAPSRCSGSTMSPPLNASQEPEGVLNFTRTGRISKAKKGVKDYHHCDCGKVGVRAVSFVGANLVAFESISASLTSMGFPFFCPLAIHILRSKPTTCLLWTPL